MGTYTKLTDAVLMSDNFIQVIKETKNFDVKTFDEFVKEVQAMDERVKACDIKTDLTFSGSEPNVNLKWVVDSGYMNDKNRVFVMTKFENGGDVECNTTYRFRAPGCVNVNKLVDANQILKLFEGMVYEMERNKVNNKNSQKQDAEDDDTKGIENSDSKNSSKDQTDEDGNFELDPSVVKVMDQLKTDGDALIKKALAVPAFEYKGKKYKPEKAELMASTEKECVANLLFPRAQEIDIYAATPEGRKLRTKLVNHFRRNGFWGKKDATFRADMDKTPYFYFPVGKIPVKSPTGPEAEALLNYFDGNKVRFQPKEK